MLHLFLSSVIFMHTFFFPFLVEPLYLSVKIHTVGLHVAAAGHMMDYHHSVTVAGVQAPSFLNFCTSV